MLMLLIFCGCAVIIVLVALVALDDGVDEKIPDDGRNKDRRNGANCAEKTTDLAQ